MAIFLVTFRETLEASIIVGLIYSMLQVFGVSTKRKRYIAYGIAAWVLWSILFAITVTYLLGSFEGTTEQIYEWVLMVLACILITRFILWTQHHFRNIWSNVKKLSETFKQSGQLWLLTFLVWLSVLREGVETVIFLNALSFSSQKWEIFLAFIWILWALIVSMILYKSLKKVKIQKLLYISNIFFIFIAGWLLAHGIVEFQEAWILPEFINPLYNLSWILSEKEGIGSILKASVHYDADPSLLSFMWYFAYMITAFYFFFINKKEM